MANEPLLPSSDALYSPYPPTTPAPVFRRHVQPLAADLSAFAIFFGPLAYPCYHISSHDTIRASSPTLLSCSCIAAIFQLHTTPSTKSTQLRHPQLSALPSALLSLPIATGCCGASLSLFTLTVCQHCRRSIQPPLCLHMIDVCKPSSIIPMPQSPMHFRGRTRFIEAPHRLTTFSTTL